VTSLNYITFVCVQRIKFIFPIDIIKFIKNYNVIYFIVLSAENLFLTLTNNRGNN